MKNKATRHIEKIEKAGKKGVLETDLFNDYESDDAVRTGRTRIRHELKKHWKSGKKLVIDGGIYFIERTGGVAGFAIMAILVVVMTTLAFYAGRVDTLAQCEEVLGIDIILETDYLIE